MPPVQFYTYLFQGGFGPQLTQQDRERSRKGLLLFLHTLTGVDKMWLAQYPKTPRLYNSGVGYHHDNGVEYWYDAPTSIERGYGDCKVFCGWRCAELQRLGVKAAPFITWRQLPSGDWMYHCLVWRPRASMSIDPAPFIDTPNGAALWPSKIDGDTGYIEDPSRILGMGWEEQFAATNKKPATAAFVQQLGQLLGKSPAPVIASGQYRRQR